MPSPPGSPDDPRLDAVVAAARRARAERERGYREQALKLLPWICGRCAREFTRANLHELTVHHRNHDHDCNPTDGSNWELLCLYCHDNEHARSLTPAAPAAAARTQRGARHAAFAELAKLLERNR